LVPEALTGTDGEMERRLKSALGNRDFSDEIRAEKRKNAMRWALCAAALALMAASFAMQALGREDASESLKRPEYNGQARSLSLRVKAWHDAESVLKNVNVLVRPKGLGEDEKRRRLDETKGRLRQIALGENESLNEVCTDLSLARTDDETQVSISWASDRPEVIDDTGELNPVAAREGEFVNLTARMSLEDISETATIVARLGKPASAEGGGVGEGIEKILGDEVARLSESVDGDELVLPDAGAFGVSYRWEAGKGAAFPAGAAILPLLGLVFFKTRYSGIEKRIAQARKSAVRDFPEFINKLLLLLNAGLVVSAAIARIAEDYESRRDVKNKRHLYEELAGMQRRIENTNASLAAELNVVASRSGVRELMRFASIVTDNIDKGSALADKLRAEGELVWNARRKGAEEAGRVAETKLVMPMSLILIVLIMITIAPAALEM
jgi:hypothetical protein